MTPILSTYDQEKKYFLDLFTSETSSMRRLNSGVLAIFVRKITFLKIFSKLFDFSMVMEYFSYNCNELSWLKARHKSWHEVFYCTAKYWTFWFFFKLIKRIVFFLPFEVLKRFDWFCCNNVERESVMTLLLWRSSLIKVHFKSKI